MKEYLIKRPMLICGIVCAAISAAGYYSRITLWVTGIVCIAIFTAAIIKKANVKVYVCLSVILVMIVSTVAASRKAERLETLNGRVHTLETVVCETTYKSEGYNLTVFEVIDGNSTLKNQKIAGFYEPCQLELGDAVKINVKLESMEEGLYKSQNFAEDIFLTGNISKIEPSDKEGDIVIKTVAKIRRYIKETLFSNVGYYEASTLCALVFGDRSYFTDEFYSNVKGAGVSHVMVVSGMHLSIFVMFFLGVTEKRYYNRYLKAAVTVGIVFIVMAVCGFTISIIRAGVTFIVAALGLILKRDNISANTLGTATVLILLTSPFAILSVAFQLSLLSTFGIIAVAVPIGEYAQNRNLIKSDIGLKLFTSVLITLSAMILTLPVVIYYFEGVSVVGVITNLLISYAVSVSLILSVIGLAVNLVFTSVAEIIFAFCEIVVKYINSVINFLGSLPFSVVSLPKYSFIFAAVLIIIIFYVLLACKKRIDMIKLKEMNEKIIEEGGKRLKWQ